MGNLMGAIHNDIEWYRYLCEYYNEKPVTDKYGINPYCEHERKLAKRHTKERERNKRK